MFNKNKWFCFFGTVALTCFLLTGVGISSETASLTVSLPTELQVVPGGEVEIPVFITGVKDKSIGAYAIRFDYDEKILSNPKIIDKGTLSEGNPNLQVYVPPSDGIGKLAVGIGFGFTLDKDGILIKMKFKVSEDFTGTTTMNFVSKNVNSVLSTANFEKINVTFKNSSLLSDKTVE
ncbi:exported hypothetical protein [Candidatus Magnetomoraceae bacterium gMMP-15]